MPEEVLLAISTFPDTQTARGIAEQLVTGKLAACVNILPAVESIYWWKEKIESGTEVMAFFKTTEKRRESFQEKLRVLHPYEVPEIIFVSISAGLPDYLHWVMQNCINPAP